MDVVNYREDEELFLKLLKEHNGDLRLATGYLNLTKEYMQAMSNLLPKWLVRTIYEKWNGSNSKYIVIRNIRYGY